MDITATIEASAAIIEKITAIQTTVRSVGLMLAVFCEIVES